MSPSSSAEDRFDDIKVMLALWVQTHLREQLGKYDLFEGHQVEVQRLTTLQTMVRMKPVDGHTMPRWFKVTVSEQR